MDAQFLARLLLRVTAPETMKMITPVTIAAITDRSLIGSNTVAGEAGDWQIGTGDGATREWELPGGIFFPNQYNVRRDKLIMTVDTTNVKFTVKAGTGMPHNNRPTLTLDDGEDTPAVGEAIWATWIEFYVCQVRRIAVGTADYELEFIFSDGRTVTFTQDNLPTALTCQPVDVRFTCTAQPATTGPTFLILGYEDLDYIGNDTGVNIG